MRMRRRCSARVSSSVPASAASSFSVASVPASIFMARLTSSEAVSRSTLPISLRYIRTGSPVSMAVEVSARRARAREERLGLATRALGTERKRLLDDLGLGDALGLLAVLVIEGVDLVVVPVVKAVLDRSVGGEVLPRLGGRRGADLHAAGAQRVIEVGELIGVDVDVLDRELNVVLAHARGGARAGHQAVHDPAQVVGELDVIVGLLGSHKCPFDV